MAATVVAVAVLLTGVHWFRPDAAPRFWAQLEGRRAGVVAAGGAIDSGADHRLVRRSGGQAAQLAGAGHPAARGRRFCRRARPRWPPSHPQDLLFVGRMRCVAGAPHTGCAFERAAGSQTSLTPSSGAADPHRSRIIGRSTSFQLTRARKPVIVVARTKNGMMPAPATPKAASDCCTGKA